MHFQSAYCNYENKNNKAIDFSIHIFFAINDDQVKLTWLLVIHSQQLGAYSRFIAAEHQLYFEPCAYMRHSSYSRKYNVYTYIFQLYILAYH